MSGDPFTASQVRALACADCPAAVHISRGQGIAGPVLVVVVEHEATCPWLARVAPGGAARSSPEGIVQHTVREPT